MGLGLRNQVEYPEIKANGPGRGVFRSSRVLPRAGAGAWRSCRCGEGQCGAEGRDPGAGVPWALSGSRQGCAQEPTAARLVRCACSAAPGAAAGAQKGGAGTDERGGRRCREPAAPPPPAPSPRATAARSAYPVPCAARIRQRLSPARACGAFCPWPVQELSCTGKRRADERRPGRCRFSASIKGLPAPAL